jgi:hypothetical protein
MPGLILLDFRDLLVSITRGGLQVTFAARYPAIINNDCINRIEDWQYITRRQFENAVYIEAYMEEVDKLQRRSKY